MKIPLSAILSQLDELIKKFEQLTKQTKYPDYSDIEEAKASEFLTAAMSAIIRTTGPNSYYTSQGEAIIKELPHYHIAMAIPHLGGTLKALRNDVASGYLTSVEELIHSTLFADFLEMANHLLSEGYKDPAAVLIGGVLEEHLRKLCSKNEIPTDRIDSHGLTQHKKAETMNIDLAGNGSYSKLDQKNVTAWLDLRNKAAHGRYTEYTHQQVELYLQSVQDFITRYPA